MVYFIPFQVATSGVEKVQKCTKLVPQGNYTLSIPDIHYMDKSICPPTYYAYRRRSAMEIYAMTVHATMLMPEEVCNSAVI